MRETLPTLNQIYGQDVTKRALIITVSGGHNILISGPPGAGKTLFAKAALMLMPPLSRPELLNVIKLHSLAGISYGRNPTHHFVALIIVAQVL